MRHAHRTLDFTSNWIETLNVPSCNQCARGSCTIFDVDSTECQLTTQPDYIYTYCITDTSSVIFGRAISLTLSKYLGKFTATMPQMQFRWCVGVTSKKDHTIRVYQFDFDRFRHSVCSPPSFCLVCVRLRNGERIGRTARNKKTPSIVLSNVEPYVWWCVMCLLEPQNGFVLVFYSSFYCIVLIVSHRS